MNIEDLLALSLVKGLGPKKIIKLMNAFDSLEQILRLPETDRRHFSLTDRRYEQLHSLDSTLINKTFRWAEHPNHHLIAINDKDYPSLLKEIYDPPPILYVKGQLSALASQTIAIVGSRKATPGGLQSAHQFGQKLSETGLTICSGLAYGIDAKAHQGCLQAQGVTIAVMGTGIDRLYPASHQVLAEAILQHGALVTEFPMGTRPTGPNFPRRNRIISGLSLGTLVVEATLNSGSLISARLALEHGREVFAIPGSIHNPNSRGCHHLIKQGAKLTETIEDIWDEIAPNTQLNQEIGKISPNRLETHLQNLVKFVGYDPTPIESLVQASGLSLIEVNSSLIQLEMYGLIKKAPGGYIKV